jgi:hypothetical protein
MKNDRTVYAIIVVFALLVLAGFYLIFDKISQLSTETKNLELSFALLQKNSAPAAAAPQPETPAPQPNPVPTSTPPLQEGVSVPTAIIFQTKSSSILQPQSDLTVTVDSVGKLGDGTVTVNIKVFSSEAQSYTALEPNQLFALVNLDGDNQQPFNVSGQFSSIPPKNAVTGAVIFKIPTTQQTIILQTGSGDNLKFYEIDFSKKTFKETIIG